jgi:hypothetical protein
VPSRGSGVLRSMLLMALLAVVAPAWAQEPQVEADAPTGAFSDQQIKDAIARVKADPNLATERKMRTLEWVKGDRKDRKADYSWLKWLGELFSWLAQNGRFLFWGILAVLAALLVIYIIRLIRTYGLPQRSARFEAPSFVRDLDIRPESLPADIGASARQLWDEGQHRAALALLYRGLLSRLVHVHGVPIRDSSTEGDCLQLASRHLSSEGRKVYVTSLVRLWQRAVYGGESVPAESVHALCNEFAGALDTPDVSAAAPGEPAAGAA